MAVQRGKKPQQRNGRRNKRVPGWGGSIGRVAKVGMSYVQKNGVAYKALNLARRIADAVNIEYKNFRVQVTPVNVDYSGAYQQLNYPGQGYTNITRVGDSIKNQNITVRGLLARNGQDAFMRVILVWDKQNDLSAVSDFLQAAGAASAVISPKKTENKYRFRTLYDQTFSLTSNNPQARFEIDLPINEHTEFSTGSTTIKTGSLSLLYVSNVVTTNLPTMHFYSQLTYTDD